MQCRQPNQMFVGVHPSWPPTVLPGVYLVMPDKLLSKLMLWSPTWYGTSCLGGAEVERRTRDRKVARLTPSRGAIKSTSQVNSAFHHSGVTQPSITLG